MAELAESAMADDLDADDGAHVTHPDTEDPDELDALPGHEGSR